MAASRRWASQLANFGGPGSHILLDGNFYTLSKRRCGPPLTSPLDRAAVAPSELSASELDHPRDEHLSRRSLPVFQAQLVDAPPARARRRCCRQDLGDFARDDEAATARG